MVRGAVVRSAAPRPVGRGARLVKQIVVGIQVDRARQARQTAQSGDLGRFAGAALPPAVVELVSELGHELVVLHEELALCFGVVRDRLRDGFHLLCELAHFGDELLATPLLFPQHGVPPVWIIQTNVIRKSGVCQAGDSCVILSYMSQSQVGLIGLAVMGSNLARNFASRGFSVSVYNRTGEKTDEFIKKFAMPTGRQGNSKLHGTPDLSAFVQSLERPRKIVIMVKAGSPVDGVIQDLLPHVEPGDIIIDAGNSFYKDTQRREQELAAKKILFVGMGVSGGEEGALKGPSLLPGGSKESWRALKKYLEAIAAKDFGGLPCVSYIGANGAGHYVKMIHNGIEYAVMQLMAETYALLKNIYGLKPPALADIFEKFSQGKLSSFLFDIAVPVLRRQDDLTGKGWLIDKILDRAGSKGTGAWASVDALERGISITSITEAVFARSVSATKEDRMNLAKLYDGKIKFKPLPIKKFVALLENALYAAMISCYAQGYDVIQKTAEQEKWDLNLAEISRIWEGGCIIRAKLLNVLHQAYQQSKLKNKSLLAVPGIVKLMKKYLPDLRAFVALTGGSGVSVSAFATALFYFQDMTSIQLPANLIQALRDNFGAHTYERTDRPGSFHTEWLA